MKSLANQVVLISGGLGRLGSAFATAVQDAGGRVCIFDLVDKSDRESLSDVSRERSVFVQGDVTNAKDIDRAIQVCKEKFGSLDAAVHSAYPTSESWGRAFEELSFDDLSANFSMQLGGSILFSQRVIRSFEQDGGGTLIHVSSIQGISPPKFWHYEGTTMTSPIEYTAIKSGVIAITRYLAKYYSHRNIRVNCISPGGILDDQPAEFLKRYRSSCVSKGMLDASDVSGVILFLLSEEACYISGQNIVVDDGWSL